MNTVLWQTRSQVLLESIKNGTLSKQANGGNSYDYQAIQALQRSFQVTMDRSAVRKSGESKYKYAFRMLRNVSAADLVIKEASVIALSPLNVAPREIGLIHHIDEELMEKSMKHRWFFSRLLKRLPRLDAVVTVSTFWKEKLEGMGCQEVHVIYNSFDVGEFEISDQDVQAFCQREEIPKDRPVLYIGGAGARKGATEVFHALKDEGYYMVVTGPRKEIDIPVRWLNLNRKDYLCLLSACDVVLTMSTMTEGWNRVAHEAMLCGTPVIGSGIGGMRELLAGGEQQIVQNLAQLRPAVHKALADNTSLSQRGQSFVRQFNLSYFNDRWLDIGYSYTNNNRATTPAFQGIAD